MLRPQASSACRACSTSGRMASTLAISNPHRAIVAEPPMPVTSVKVELATCSRRGGNSAGINVLGCKFLFSEGPFDIDDARAAAHHVAPGTVLHNLTLLRCANGACLELFEYRVAGQRQAPVRNVDNGGHHIAFQVDDIDAATARLREAGVAICSAVNRSQAGPFKGLAWVYFLAPWGLQLELVEMPVAGIGHEQATGTRMYRPV